MGQAMQSAGNGVRLGESSSRLWTNHEQFKGQNLSLTWEMYKGLGYRFHSGRLSENVVAVKVFEGGQTKEVSPYSKSWSLSVISSHCSGGKGLFHSIKERCMSIGSAFAQILQRWQLAYYFISHPNVLLMTGASPGPGNPYLVFEGGGYML